MTGAPTRWQRLAVALDQLLDATPAARPSLLADMTPSLRQRAQAALDAIEKPNALDDLAAQAAAAREPPAPESLIGSRIGDFELTELLGVGGMSWVYRARREQGGAVQCVALKRLRPDLSSAQLRQRFAVEQRIIGQLQHPGIARLIAAGMDDSGVPWLATELVEGQPLLSFCDARRLGVDGRLRLFVRVCEAVAAAHRALIVHRDLKPANVLVNADGAPKLLDFGISRLTDDGHENTRAEWRVLTPEYAAPEQLAGGAPHIAMDVYALGVMLYELLCGARPPAALYRKPGDTVTPPSAALKPDAAAARASTPAALRRRLHGDLDAIVLHALEFDPERRYAQVEALVRDVRAALAKRPISLYRRRWLYTVRRFVQRNAEACALAVLALLAAGVGAAGVLRESAHRQQALERALAAESFLTGLFNSATLSTREAAQRPVSELLGDGAREAAVLSATRPELAAHLLFTIANAQDQLDQHEAAIANYEAAVAAARDAAPSDATLETIAAAQIGHAWVLLRLGEDKERVAALLGEAVPALRAHAPNHPLLARGLSMQAKQAHANNDPAQAESLYRQAIALIDRVAPDDIAAIDTRSDLGVLYELTGRIDEAVEVEGEAYARVREKLPPDHYTPNMIGINYGKALGRQGRWAEADALMRETGARLVAILPPDNTNLVPIHIERARVAVLLDRLDEADELLRIALAALQARTEPLEAQIASFRIHVGALRERQGRKDDALAEIDAAWRWWMANGGSASALACWAQGASARLLFDLKRDDEGMARLAEATGCTGATMDEARARALWAQGRHDEAREAWAKLLVPRRDTPHGRLSLLDRRIRYAGLLRGIGAFDEARVQLRQVIEDCAAVGVTSNPDLRTAREWLAREP